MEFFSQFIGVVEKYAEHLIAPPIRQLSFQGDGISYLKGVIKLLDSVSNPKTQIINLNTLPDKQSLEQALLVVEQNAAELSFITKDMLVRGQLLCEKDCHKLYDFSALKASILCQYSSSPNDYGVAARFFKTLTQYGFSDTELVLLTQQFFSAKDIMIADLADYLSVAFTLKQKLGESVFRKIYSYECAAEQIDITDIINTAQLIIKMPRYVETEKLVMKSNSGFAKLKLMLANAQQKENAAKYTESDIDQVIKNFANVEFPLSDAELVKMKQIYVQMQKYGQHYQSFSPAQLAREGLQQAKAFKVNPVIYGEASLKILAAIRLMIDAEFGITPYNTQMLVVISILAEQEGYKGRIAEVLTGEGKSLIITTLATFLALTGQPVDIITSSKSLAVRDQAKYEKFFGHFGISTSHICHQEPDAKHFTAQVLYGTNYDFEFAILRSKLYGKKLYSAEGRTVIVDELDNLFLDTALNSARISFPAPKDVSWIYEPILKTVQNNLGKFISVGLIKNALQRHDSSAFKKFSDYFTNEYISTLISSARKAINFKLNKNYVIYFDAEKEINKVVIVDWQNTGRLNHGSRWSYGIHEFLEILNGLKPETESLTAASISHPAFFNLYTKIYGLTGTIGESQEREEIKAIYHVDFYDVPPHLPSQRTPVQIKYAPRQYTYDKQIIDSTQNMVKVGRPVLILCKSIEDSMVISRKLDNKNIKHTVLNEIQEISEETVLANAGKKSVVTVATNTAGRGTDIILSTDSIVNGGLHVIITFLPTNLRVEDQACGRAGRQGQPGSCEMVVNGQDYDLQAVKTKLIGLSNQDAVNELLAQRAQSTESLSIYRLKSAQYHIEIFKLFDLFAESLADIRSNLNFLSTSNLASTYHEVFISTQRICPKDNALLDSLYKQAYGMIWHQSMGHWVNWEPFLEKSKEVYVKYISQLWAKFYSNIDKGTDANNDAAELKIKYDKFYAYSLEDRIKNPIKKFMDFTNKIVEQSASYWACLDLEEWDLPNQRNSSYVSGQYKEFDFNQHGYAAEEMGSYDYS